MSTQLDVGLLIDVAFEWLVKSDAANPSKVVSPRPMALLDVADRALHGLFL